MPVTAYRVDASDDDPAPTCDVPVVDVTPGMDASDDDPAPTGDAPVVDATRVTALDEPAPSGDVPVVVGIGAGASNVSSAAPVWSTPIAVAVTVNRK